MTDRILGPRTLNRALLARQLLLEPATLSVPEALEQVGGLQAQYAPSGYVGLWARLAGFRRPDLTAALERREAVQATLMRTTIHLVSGREFWRYAIAVRQARREWALRLRPPSERVAAERESEAAAERMRTALADGPRTVRELGPMAAGFLGNLGLWVDLVRVPPSGTWERRRADRLALAEEWIGPPDVTEAESLAHVVRGYLRAFGPAPWRDVASWAGIPAPTLRAGAADLTLVAYRDADGQPLVDLEGAPLPDPSTPAPIRFLPHWDATLLVHARRTGILPEAHRSKVFSSRNPFSVGTYLVDGQVAGAWTVRDGHVRIDPYEPLRSRDRDALEAARSALEAFHA